MKKFTKFTVIACTALMATTNVLAKDVYVSANGNDANSGLTPDQPRATLTSLTELLDPETGDNVIHVSGFISMKKEKALMEGKNFDQATMEGVWGKWDDQGSIEGFFLDGTTDMNKAGKQWHWRGAKFVGEDPEKDGFTGENELPLFFIFGWNSPEFVFENLGFKDALSNQAGGAIFMKNTGKGTFNNCRFTNLHCDMSKFPNKNDDGNWVAGNGASERGGAIRIIWGATLTLNDCVFEGCYNRKGGGVFISGGTANITRCTFRDNGFRGENDEYINEDNGGGAAICVWTLNTEATVKIDHCLFDGNRVWNNGGAVLLYNNTNSGRYQDVTISNSAFFNNTAERGGAIAIINGVTKDQGNRDNSKSIFLKLVNTTVSKNQSRVDGGGICLWGGGDGSADHVYDKLWMVNCTVSGNETNGNAGHGAGFKEMAHGDNGSPNFTDRYFYNTIFEGNMALESEEYSDFVTGFTYQNIDNSYIGRLILLDGVEYEDFLATLNDGAGTETCKIRYAADIIGGEIEDVQYLDDGAQTTTNMYTLSNGIVTFIPVPDDSELLGAGDNKFTKEDSWTFTCTNGTSNKTISGYDCSATDQVGFARGESPVVGASEATLSQITEGGYFEGDKDFPYLSTGIENTVVTKDFSFVRNGNVISVDGAAIKVCDIQGRVVLRGKNHVNISSIPAGLYIVVADAAGKSSAVKILK